MKPKVGMKYVYKYDKSIRLVVKEVGKDFIRIMYINHSNLLFVGGHHVWLNELYGSFSEHHILLNKFFNRLYDVKNQ